MRHRLSALRQSIQGSPGIVALIVASLVLPFLRGIPVASLATLPLVFVLPGIAVHAALLPRMRLFEWETVPIVLGVSAAIVIATGLALDFTPGGLDPAAWTLLLTIITVGAGLLALVRRANRPADAAHDTASAPTWRPSLLEAGQLVAALAVVGALLIAARTLGGIPQTAFTQLWMIPGETASTVEIGVTNREGDAEAYVLVVSVDGEQVESVEIELDDGDTWTRTLALDVPEDGLVQADLYRLPDRATPYRMATLSTEEASPVLETPAPSPS